MDTYVFASTPDGAAACMTPIGLMATSKKGAQRLILPISRCASAHLDIVRGIAALAVMMGHLRGLFFVEYPQIVHRNILVSAAYLLTTLGHQAVMVFFVLSGFFISRSVLDAFRKDRWSWRVFLINRSTRLLLVLVPALLLCAAWDHFGMRLPAAGGFYYHGIPNFDNVPVAASRSPRVFLGNLLFLQSIYFPPFGSDKPLWSLSYEFWYYLLFPILLVVFAAHGSLARRIVHAVIALAIFMMVGREIALLFLVWLAGAAMGVLHDLKPRLTLRGFFAWPALGCGVAGLILVKFRAPQGLPSEFLTAAAFLPVIYVLVHAKGERVNRVYAAVAHTLSSCSYTLYLVHLPLLIFLRTLLGRVPRWQPNFSHAFLALALAAFVLAYAWAIAWCTEARTGQVRRLLLSKR